MEPSCLGCPPGAQNSLINTLFKSNLSGETYKGTLNRTGLSVGPKKLPGCGYSEVDAQSVTVVKPKLSCLSWEVF